LDRKRYSTRKRDWQIQKMGKIEAHPEEGGRKTTENFRTPQEKGSTTRDVANSDPARLGGSRQNQQRRGGEDQDTRRREGNLQNCPKTKGCPIRSHGPRCHTGSREKMKNRLRESWKMEVPPPKNGSLRIVASPHRL